MPAPRLAIKARSKWFSAPMDWAFLKKFTPLEMGVETLQETAGGEGRRL